jgi:autotransporter translocation and assembly factor TamB
MTLTDGHLEATATVRRALGGSADVSAEIADVRASDSRVEGAVRVEWPDVGFLVLLSPELEQVDGAIAVNLDVGGTVDEPTVDGRAVFSDGRIDLPRWGLVVEGIEAMATSRDGRSLAIDATGRAGDGVLTLAGTTELDPSSGWPTQLTLRGDTVRVVQLPEVEIFASPNLRVDVSLPVAEVTGRVHIPRAAIALGVLPAQAVTPSPDAVARLRDHRRARPIQPRTAIEPRRDDVLPGSTSTRRLPASCASRCPTLPRTRRARCASPARTMRTARSSSSTAASYCSAGRSTTPGSTCAPSAGSSVPTSALVQLRSASSSRAH